MDQFALTGGGGAYASRSYNTEKGQMLARLVERDLVTYPF